MLKVTAQINGERIVRYARDRCEARHMLPVAWNFPPVHAGSPFAAINFVGGDWQSVEHFPTRLA